ncbi:unnamed protein product [Larinioides sclopetarius]|uniref:Transmembrane protein n=2 Tax=Larinioides sclopetarius TaxID=280406 RepID=A0AAV2C1D0_9ARAC
MDVSTEQDGDGWVNRAFGVPSVPENRRDYYPFSRCTALAYRLKLAVVLLNAACALFRGGEPCLRLSLLFNCWLVCITCEGVYKNYPWREPLNVWMWSLRWAVPCWEVLSTSCVVLLLLVWTQLGAGCEMSHPLLSVFVGWLCCMVAWPLVKVRWNREERSEDDYDQFSVSRPCMLTFPGPFGLVLAALRSPSLLALLTASLAFSVAALFLPGWFADVWAASTGALTLGCLAVLCCHRLPEDVGRTLAVWEVDEASYLRRIENSLRMVKGNLRTSGLPREGSTRFDRLAVQLPLLQREAHILLTSSRTLTESRAKELGELTAARELTEFGEMLDHYGPYSTECCVS